MVLVSRESGSGAAVAETLRRESGNEKLYHLPADLSSPADIRRVAAQVNERFSRLDVLVNNAGAFFSSRQTTADGYEMTFALNHLSYFLLTHLLLGRLLQSPAPRIVNVASRAESFGTLHDDPMLEKNYGGWRAYGQSKLANLLFSYQLARFLVATPVTVNALHPGTVATGFGSGGRTSSFLLKVVRPLLKTPVQGAQTAIYLASSPDVAGTSGCYFIDKKPASSSKQSHDREAQVRLWRVSRDLVGLTEAEAAPLRQVAPTHERVHL